MGQNKRKDGRTGLWNNRKHHTICTCLMVPGFKCRKENGSLEPLTSYCFTSAAENRTETSSVVQYSHTRQEITCYRCSRKVQTLLTLRLVCLGLYYHISNHVRHFVSGYGTKVCSSLCNQIRKRHHLPWSLFPGNSGTTGRTVVTTRWSPLVKRKKRKWGETSVNVQVSTG